MQQLFTDPKLSALTDNQAAMSVLVNNPKIRARTLARPDQMCAVVIELARTNPGAAHYEGALDLRFPTLHLKDSEVRAIPQAESPAASMVREHHQTAMGHLNGKSGAPPQNSPAARTEKPSRYTSGGQVAQLSPEQAPTRTQEEPFSRGPRFGQEEPRPHAQNTGRAPTTTAVDARTLTAGSKIRELLGETLIDRSPTNRPRWGGCLVALLVNARGPFGISTISDTLAPVVEEFKKEHPRLVATLVRNDGVWPAPSDAESLELMHFSAKVWARRLLRPILLGTIDHHRKHVAELNGDPKPKWFTHDDLDKELRAAKDVHGEYLINPVLAAKRQRD